MLVEIMGPMLGNSKRYEIFSRHVNIENEADSCASKTSHRLIIISQAMRLGEYLKP